MKMNIYLKLQKKFGGNWIASSSNGKVIFASAREVDGIFKKLKEKKFLLKKPLLDL